MPSNYKNNNRKGSDGEPTRLPVWKKNFQNTEPCHWSDVDVTAIRLCVDAVTRAGGAIMLGLTSDGGAYSICILYRDEKLKEYPHGPDNCVALLKAITDDFVEALG